MTTAMTTTTQADGGGVLPKNHFVTLEAAAADIDDSLKRQEDLPIGGVVRNATSLIQQRLCRGLNA